MLVPDSYRPQYLSAVVFSSHSGHVNYCTNDCQGHKRYTKINKSNADSQEKKQKFTLCISQLCFGRVCDPIMSWKKRLPSPYTSISILVKFQCISYLIEIICLLRHHCRLVEVGSSLRLLDLIQICLAVTFHVYPDLLSAKLTAYYITFRLELCLWTPEMWLFSCQLDRGI